jgi:hypothetical protein
MPHRSKQRFLLLVSFALVTACGSADGSAADDFVVRDSAGVRIAQNGAPAWRDGQGWRLADQPALEIGMMDGPPAYQFAQISGLARLGDGRLVVADGQAKEVRWFDAEGRHLRTAGGEGGGPGEFRGMSSMLRTRGDTVAVGDSGNRRITFFSPDGAMAGEISLAAEATEGSPRPRAVLADGSILFSRSPSFRPGSETGLIRNPMTILRLALPEETWSTVAEIPGSEVFVERMGTSGISVTTLPFGRNAFLAPAGQRFWAASNDRFEIRRLAADGSPELVVRRTLPERPVTPADFDRVLEQRLSWWKDPDERRTQERKLRELPIPSTMPAFADLMSATDGYLWVREYPLDEDAPREWWVIEPDGRLLGSVTTPASFRVFEIGSDYVLGVWTDELDVPYVQMYTLEKPAR